MASHTVEPSYRALPQNFYLCTAYPVCQAESGFRLLLTSIGLLIGFLSDSHRWPVTPLAIQILPSVRGLTHLLSGGGVCRLRPGKKKAAEGSFFSLDTRRWSASTHARGPQGCPDVGTDVARVVVELRSRTASSGDIPRANCNRNMQARSYRVYSNGV